MSRRNTLHKLILSGFATTLLCVLALSVVAQKVPKATDGAPLGGVDIKLGRSAGGGSAARATSDEKGYFAFSNVAAGRYTVTLNVKPVSPSTNRAAGSATPLNPLEVFCYLTLNLPGGQTLTKWYNVKTNEASVVPIDPSKLSTLKAKDFQNLVVVVPAGGGPVNGTITKAKANITNN